MEAILQFLLPVALVAVFIVLMTGIVGFAIGGEFNRKYANKLMRLRVAAQTITIVLLLLLLLVKGFFS